MFGRGIGLTLSQSKVFKGLTDDELKPLSRYFRRLRVKEKDAVIHEGQVNESLFVVTKGEFQALLPEHVEGKKAHRFSEVKLSKMREGDCFGEFSLLDGKPASASVVATTPGELLEITRRELSSVLNSDDHLGRVVYHNLIQILIQKIRRQNRDCDLLLTLE